MNAGIYCRISADKVGAGLGVKRQREDCEALAKLKGWTVSDVYVDNDISAYSGKQRPEYRRLLRDVAADRVQAIIAWHTDRLHRSPRELEEFIDICEAHKVHVETVRAGELDLKTPAGRAVARTLGAWARYESEHRSERVRRKATELAQSGVPHMGGPRYYGYEPDRVTIVPAEAAVVREATERALAGESLRAICMDLNRRGLFTSTGKKWSTTRLKAVLLAPHRAGLIEHHTAGRVTGKWPAIISEQQRTRLLALLNDPSRRTNPGAPRRRLLGGILRCGECGAKLVGSRGRSNRNPLIVQEQYRCATREHAGCGRIAISARLVEPHVTEAVLTTLDRLQLDANTPDPHDQAEIDAVADDQQQLRELASLYASRTISADEWIRARTEIDQRIAERNRRIADRTVDQRLRDLLAGHPRSVREAWPNLTVEQQRAIISTVLERVSVNRARTTRSFDPTRLEPVWRF